MPPRPRIVSLRLTRPRIGDGDGNRALVQAVQHRLRGYGLEQDGIYGPRTALGVAIWQERAGCPHVSGAIVPDELLVLLGYRGVPRAWVRLRGDKERTGRAKAAQRHLSELAAKERAESSRGLRIIPREDWCTISARGRSVAMHPDGVPHVVHWFGPGAAAVGLDAGIAQVNGFARYHIVSNGWADLGYNFAILRDGHGGGLCTVLEGRGDDTRGAHSGHNQANAYPGVLILCGSGTPTPTAEQYATLVALRTLKRWGRRTGHLEWSPTDCPGPILWPWVQAHR